MPEKVSKTSSLYGALLSFQAEATTLAKDSENPHFKNAYIGLDSLVEQVLPLLNKNGIVVTQDVTIADGSPALTTTLIHAESGESHAATMFLVLDKDTPQGQGSAITYARRYQLMAMLSLVADVDDDGSAAGKTKSTYKRVTKKKEATSTPATDADGTGAQFSF